MLGTKNRLSIWFLLNLITRFKIWHLFIPIPCYIILGLKARTNQLDFLYQILISQAFAKEHNKFITTPNKKIRLVRIFLFGAYRQLKFT